MRNGDRERPAAQTTRKEELSGPEGAVTTLLIEAIQDVNISRRNVGLYPRNHPQTRESLSRTIDALQRLFETRQGISLGIAKDTVLVDGAPIEKKSPVLAEFAGGLHARGITAITIEPEIAAASLSAFHELLAERENLIGMALVERAGERNLKHIRLSPLDLSKFRFVEGIIRKDHNDRTFWNEFIAALLEGGLTADDADAVITSVTPEEMAAFINANTSGTDAESACAAIIGAYTGKAVREERRIALFGKFLRMAEGLRPDLRPRFLQRALTFPAMDMQEIYALLEGLTFDSMQRLMDIFEEQEALLPEQVRQLIEKLRTASADVFCRVSPFGPLRMDDIEVDGETAAALDENPECGYIDREYRAELTTLMGAEHRERGDLSRHIEAA